METHREIGLSIPPLQEQQEERITGQDPPRQQLQVRRRLDGPSKLVSSSLLFLAVISSAGIVSVLTAPRSGMDVNKAPITSLFNIQIIQFNSVLAITLWQNHGYNEQI